MWWWHLLAQKLLVNSGSDRREGHALAGRAKLNVVSLNASEMMRLLHSWADLFILSPCLPYTYYVEIWTVLGCQAGYSKVGEWLQWLQIWHKKCFRNFESQFRGLNDDCLYKCCRLPRCTYFVLNSLLIGASSCHIQHTNKDGCLSCFSVYAYQMFWSLVKVCYLCSVSFCFLLFLGVDEGHQVTLI